MRKQFAILALLLLPSTALAQFTRVEVGAARSRLRLATERAILSFELSDPYHSAKIEYQTAMDQWNDAKNDALAHVHASLRYQEMQDKLVYLLTVQAPDAAVLELRMQMRQMEKDQLAMSGYQMAKERFRRAVAKMNDLEKAKRLAVISNPDWRYAWETLQDARIRYAEFQAQLAYNYYNNYYYRTYPVIY